jgi:hypothetical protein
MRRKIALKNRGLQLAQLLGQEYWRQIRPNIVQDIRAGGIRTHDLLNPIQAHYQAVLRPDFEGEVFTTDWEISSGQVRSRIVTCRPGDRTTKLGLVRLCVRRFEFGKAICRVVLSRKFV